MHNHLKLFPKEGVIIYFIKKLASLFREYSRKKPKIDLELLFTSNNLSFVFIFFPTLFFPISLESVVIPVKFLFKSKNSELFSFMLENILLRKKHYYSRLYTGIHWKNILKLITSWIFTSIFSQNLSKYKHWPLFQIGLIHKTINLVSIKYGVLYCTILKFCWVCASCKLWLPLNFIIYVRVRSMNSLAFIGGMQKNKRVGPACFFATKRFWKGHSIHSRL